MYYTILICMYVLFTRKVIYQSLIIIYSIKKHNNGYMQASQNVEKSRYKFFRKVELLDSLRSVNMAIREGWNPIQEQCRVSLHQVDRQLLVQVASCHRLLHSCLPGESSCQLPDLLDSCLMPPSQSLYWQR